MRARRARPAVELDFVKQSQRLRRASAPLCRLRPKEQNMDGNPGREPSAPHFRSFYGQNSKAAARRGRSTSI
jgi:hypothetical protein